MTIEQLYKFDNNLYAFLLLGILLFVVVKKKDIYDFSRKLFYSMIIFNMAVLLVEVLAWAFDGIVTPAAIFANYLFNILLILFEPIMAALWVSYVDYKIHGSRKRLNRRMFYMHPSLFAALLLIINIFEPIAFSIDDKNVYHRGPFLWLSLVFVLGLVLYTIVLSFKNRKTMSESMIAFIAVFALLPVLVSFIQLFVYGIILTWAVVALGVVFAYYLLEISGSSIDYLTRLQSRKKIEEIIRGQIEKKQVFSVILIDLEYFKRVNDKYGHKTGDEVLIHFSKALKIAFSDRTYVSRIGGDEFMIVLRDGNDETVLKYKASLKATLEEYDQYDILKEVGFSFGFKTFTADSKITVSKVFDDVDVLMYQDKSKNKNLKRRITD